MIAKLIWDACYKNKGRISCLNNLKSVWRLSSSTGKLFHNLIVRKIKELADCSVWAKEIRKLLQLEKMMINGEG